MGLFECKGMGEEVFGSREVLRASAIDRKLGGLTANRVQIRDAVTTGGNPLPRDDEPNVTRFKSAAAKRVQAHRARARMGLRCLTVRVSDRTVRHLIGGGGRDRP